jgi:hypothetical protein
MACFIAQSVRCQDYDWSSVNKGYNKVSPKWDKRFWMQTVSTERIVSILLFCYVVSNEKKLINMILGFHSSKDLECGNLSCSGVQSSRWVPMFCVKLLRP